MLNNALRRFVEVILDKRHIDTDDVKMLQRNVLPEGATSREDIDVLVALDRAVAKKCDDWADWLVAISVDFVVWSSRPTGHVNRDQAFWLVSSLENGDGPTQNAIRLAFEVVREAESCDEVLLSFILRHRAPLPAVAEMRLERAVLVS